MDQLAETLIKPIISIGGVNADLNRAFGVDGTVTVSLALHCSETKLELTCDKEDRPRDTPYQHHHSPTWRKDYAAFRCLQ
jgi:hypothetical protein